WRRPRACPWCRTRISTIAVKLASKRKFVGRQVRGRLHGHAEGQGILVLEPEWRQVIDHIALADLKELQGLALCEHVGDMATDLCGSTADAASGYHGDVDEATIAAADNVVGGRDFGSDEGAVEGAVMDAVVPEFAEGP